MRALSTAALVMTPSLLLPDASPQANDVMLLVALFAALFVIVEYAAVYPSLIEFRDAPPFNRVRFFILLIAVVLIALACRGVGTPSTLTRLLQAIGLLLGQAMDVPLSPIRLILWLVPEGATATQAQLLRMAAGLACLVALVGVTVFAVLIRLRNWPSPHGSFNVWINLPTFDPSAGEDVVKRLNRDGTINICLGLVLPYLMPPLALFIGRAYNLSVFGNDLLLVWVIALWAFLPAALFLRGIAMRRLALMISRKRRRYNAEAGTEDPDFLPA